MKFEIRWIDVTAHLHRGQQPVFILERPPIPGHDVPDPFSQAERSRAGVFWVPQGSLLAEPLPWSMTKTGTYVSVPINGYQTARAMSALVATGLQIGLQAIASFTAKTGLSVQTAWLILGQECTDLPAKDAFRCYVGLALQTE